MHDNKVKLNDIERPDLKVKRVLARVGKWTYLELSDGQRIRATTLREALDIAPGQQATALLAGRRGCSERVKRGLSA